MATACFLLLLWLGAVVPALAQTTKPTQPLLCGTEELAPAQRQALEAEAAFALKTKRATQGKATVITYVPIRPHILRRSNGTGGFTMSQLNTVMALTNRRYLQNGLGIQFYLAGTSPDYVDNDTWFTNFDGLSATENAIANPRDASNAMNAYFTQGMPNNGYAYFPDNALYSTRMFLKGTLDTYYLGSGTMPHELGHNFNLIHTFGTDAATDELVTRGAGKNCDIAGDLVCDTPADPGRSYPGFSVTNQNGCDAYTGNCQDANGASFSPDVTNLMSYYNSTACRDHFTPGQYDRIDAGLATRQGHTAYSLNYPSTNINAPTDVVATRAGNTMVITWQDNATNEMGYFIERSTTSSTGGFTPIGGVAPNVTTFTDNEAPANGAVYYRVRPSNSTGNISAVICRPVFVYGCTRAVGFDGFTINNVVLSQNTGCASGTVGYSAYYNTLPTVLPGQAYSFSGTLLGNQVGITIWADLNRNGSFGDAGEKLFQTPAATLTTTFSGNLTIPVGTTPGGLPLRIASSYLNVPAGPCNNYDDGETEDYQLNVVTTRYVSQAGTNTNPASATSWASATADLRGAIDISQAGDWVFVKTGLYKPTTGADRTISFAMKNGVTITGGYAGTGASPDARTPLSTTLSGNIGDPNSTTDNSYHVIVNPAGLTSTAILDGFVITGGASDSEYGGGMYNGQDSSPVLRNCLFHANSALSGGGIYNNGSPDIINCVFQNNSAAYGGAMLNDGETGTANPQLFSCSFQNNTASFAGAIYNKGSSSPSLINCVLFGNGGSNTFFNQGSASLFASYSLFEPSAVTAAGVNINTPGNITTIMSPFASTVTTQLAPCSPAIDAGDSFYNLTTGTDLAGNPRIANGRIDMGAYEFSAFPTRLYVRAGATGANTGLSWADAFTDLQSALNPTCGNSLTAIWVAVGMYKPTGTPTASTTARSISFAMKNGVTILGGFAGTGGSPDVRTPLSSTLSGNISSTALTSDNSYHVIENPSGLTSTAILDGFVITGGNADGGSSGYTSGGGIYNRANNGQVCSPTIRNCLFMDNYGGSGGAIANVGSTSGSSSPTVINCGFQNNSAGAYGGAVYNNRITGGSSRPVFINCSFLGNYTGGGGAAVFNDNNSSSGITSTTLTNCVFYNTGGDNTFFSFESGSVFATYCLFEASVTGYVSGPGNLTISGVNSPFASYNSIQLSACSPAINAGLNSAITATGVATDIAGNSRFYAGGTVDMGAYEFDSPLPTITNLSIGTPAATSVTATWTMTPATAPTEIRWRAIGTTAWSSATTTAGVTTYAITDLNAGTSYEWQLRMVCAAAVGAGYVAGNDFTMSGTYCPAMTTTKAGVWNDPTVWSCNRVPTNTDAVTIRHVIGVGGGVIGNALKISYGSGGKLLFATGGKVRLGL